MQDTNRNIRLPEFVSLDVTYRCNLRCVHCYNNSGALYINAGQPTLRVKQILVGGLE